MMVRRMIALMVLPAALMAPAGADETSFIAPPYEHREHVAECGQATMATCEADAGFDPATGASFISLEIAAEQPVGVGRGSATAGIAFGATEETSVAEALIGYQVDIDVVYAGAFVNGHLATTAGSLAGGEARMVAVATASHSGCSCTAASTTVLAQEPGPGEPIQETTISVELLLQPEEGQDLIPPGTVDLQIGFLASARVGSTLSPGVPVLDSGQASVRLHVTSTTVRRIA